jgi:hypothetical protein
VEPVRVPLLSTEDMASDASAAEKDAVVKNVAARTSNKATQTCFVIYLFCQALYHAEAAKPPPTKGPALIYTGCVVLDRGTI